MATVVELPPPVHGPAMTPHHRRIRLASRGLAWLFSGLLVVVGLIAAVLIAGVVIYPGDDYRIGSTAVWIGSGSADSVAFHTLPLGQRLAYAVVGAVRIAPTLMIFWHLRRLFGLYATGVVFSRANASHIGWSGAWLAAYAVTPFLCHLFLASLGWEIDKNWLHLSSLQALILGALVFVIAQVMQVGREIEEDREAFV